MKITNLIIKIFVVLSVALSVAPTYANKVKAAKEVGQAAEGSFGRFKNWVSDFFRDDDAVDISGKEAREEAETLTGKKIGDEAEVNAKKGKTKDTNIEIELFDPETILKETTRDYTDLAKKGRFDDLVPDEELISQFIAILKNPEMPNILLSAEAGMGKTADIQAFAKYLVGISDEERKALMKKYSKDFEDLFDELDELNKKSGLSGELLDRQKHLQMTIGHFDPKRFGFSNVKILELNVDTLEAGTHYVGSLSQKIEAIFKAIDLEREKGTEVILFIDEIHKLGKVSSGSNSSGITDKFKEKLLAGYKVIGASTPQEIADNIAKDKAFMRRFTEIKKRALTLEQNLAILTGKAKGMMDFYKVKINRDVLILASEYGKRFYPAFEWPGSAIKVLNYVVGKKSMVGLDEPSQLTKLRNELKRLFDEKKALDTRIQETRAQGVSTAALEEKSQSLLAEYNQKNKIAHKIYDKWMEVKPFAEAIDDLHKKVDKLKAETKSIKLDIENSAKPLNALLEELKGKDASLLNQNSFGLLGLNKKAIENSKDQLTDDVKQLITDIETKTKELDDLSKKITENNKAINNTEEEIAIQMTERSKEFGDDDFGVLTEEDMRLGMMTKAGKDEDVILRSAKEIEEALNVKVSELAGEEVSTKIMRTQSISISETKLDAKLPNAMMLTGDNNLIQRIGDAIAETQFGSGKKALVFDMDRMGESVVDFIGTLTSEARPKQGALVKAIENQPMQVVVIKNIEKIKDIEILKALKEIIENGSIRVNYESGMEIVNFADTEIILTSEKLTKELAENPDVAAAVNSKNGRLQVVELAKKFGELDKGATDMFGRANETGARLMDLVKSTKAFVPMGELKKDDYLDFAKNAFPKVIKAVAERNMGFRVTPKVYDWMVSQVNELDGAIEEFGNIVESDIWPQIAEQFKNVNKTSEDVVLELDLVDGQPVVKVIK